MGFILKVELTELADGLGVQCERRKRVEDESKVLARAPGSMIGLLLRRGRPRCSGIWGYGRKSGV